MYWSFLVSENYFENMISYVLFYYLLIILFAIFKYHSFLTISKFLTVCPTFSIKNTQVSKVCLQHCAD